MATLTTSEQLLAASEAYSFGSYGGKVRLLVYGRLTGQSVADNCSTVILRLVRAIDGNSSGVGYRYDSASASVSGELEQSWSGGSSGGYLYVGEHEIAAWEFTLSHNADGSRQVVFDAAYDDTYISPRTLSGIVFALPPLARTCTIAGVQTHDGEGVTVEVSGRLSTWLTVYAGETEIFSQAYLSGQTLWMAPSQQLAVARAAGQAAAATLTLVLTTYTDHNYTTAVGSVSQSVEFPLRGQLRVGQRPGRVFVYRNGAWRAAMAFVYAGAWRAGR